MKWLLSAPGDKGEDLQPSSLLASCGHKYTWHPTPETGLRKSKFTFTGCERRKEAWWWVAGPKRDSKHSLREGLTFTSVTLSRDSVGTPTHRQGAQQPILRLQRYISGLELGRESDLFWVYAISEFREQGPDKSLPYLSNSNDWQLEWRWGFEPYHNCVQTKGFWSENGKSGRPRGSGLETEGICCMETCSISPRKLGLFYLLIHLKKYGGFIYSRPPGICLLHMPSTRQLGFLLPWLIFSFEAIAYGIFFLQPILTCIKN